MINFNTIGTGSSGNCFLLDDEIMIDCGLPYSKTKDHIENVKAVLLTHIHGDHFNTSTIRKLSIHDNNIQFYCGEWLKDKASNIVNDSQINIMEFGKVYSINEYKFSMVEAYHDVENCGYRIMKDSYKHFHITDTSTLEGITALNYNSASIECNHEINKALELIEQSKEDEEFSHLRGAINSHLSVDKVIKFCKENNIKKLYPVHIGNSTKKEVIQKLKEW